MINMQLKKKMLQKLNLKHSFLQYLLIKQIIVSVFFKEERAYCFAHVGWSVSRSICNHLVSDQ